MNWETERDWFHCAKCHCLWRPSGAARGPCPQGGEHAPSASANYSLLRASPTAIGLSDWRLCRKCCSLWYSGAEDDSVCPAGGPHVKTASANYTLATGAGYGERGWRRCRKCQALWRSPSDVQSACPGGGGHDQAHSGSFRLPRVTARLRLHLKLLADTDILLEALMDNTREIYAAAGIDIEWASTERLNIPRLRDVEVKACKVGTTAEQDELFTHRKSVQANEIVIYVVRSTDPPTNGCATHPPGKPGALIVSSASEWSLPHEIGHVLGLQHVEGSQTRLMTKIGTANITNPPPDLTQSEIDTVLASVLTTNV